MFLSNCVSLSLFLWRACALVFCAFASLCVSSFCSQALKVCCPVGFYEEAVAFCSRLIPRVSMTLKKWVHDPLILGNDQPFLKGHGDSR